MRTQYQDFLVHHGRLGQKWGVKNGPPYPLQLKGRSYGSIMKKKKKLPEAEVATKKEGSSDRASQNQSRAASDVYKKWDNDTLLSTRKEVKDVHDELNKIPKKHRTEAQQRQYEDTKQKLSLLDKELNRRSSKDFDASASNNPSLRANLDTIEQMIRQHMINETNRSIDLNNQTVNNVVTQQMMFGKGQKQGSIADRAKSFLKNYNSPEAKAAREARRHEENLKMMENMRAHDERAAQKQKTKDLKAEREEHQRRLKEIEAELKKDKEERSHEKAMKMLEKYQKKNGSDVEDTSGSEERGSITDREGSSRDWSKTEKAIEKQSSKSLRNSFQEAQFWKEDLRDRLTETKDPKERAEIQKSINEIDKRRQLIQKELDSRRKNGDADTLTQTQGSLREKAKQAIEKYNSPEEKTKRAAARAERERVRAEKAVEKAIKRSERSEARAERKRERAEAKAEAAREAAAAERKKFLDNATPEQILKRHDEFTTKEVDDAIVRIRQRQTLQSLSETEKSQTERFIKNTFNKVNTVEKFVSTSIKLYDDYEDFMNILNKRPRRKDQKKNDDKKKE